MIKNYQKWLLCNYIFHTKALFLDDLQKMIMRTKKVYKKFIIDELLKNISDIKKEDIKIEFCFTSENI